MGVPYCYNKIFKKSYKNNKVNNKKFISLWKFRFDFNIKLEKLLKKKKIIKVKNINGGYVSICYSVKYFNFICSILSKDIHGLLEKKPKYKIDSYPYI